MEVLVRLAFLLWAVLMGLLFGSFVGVVSGTMLDIHLAPTGFSFALAGGYLGAAIGISLCLTWMGRSLARSA